VDRLVAFSCKGRAVCPSCGGRGMAERAAHLVDRVFPEVPVRQPRGGMKAHHTGAVASDDDTERRRVGPPARR
jgi:hypothetical protein